MNSLAGFPEIPDLKESPWLKPIVELFDKQSRMIQEQAQVIQEQAQVIQEQAQVIQEQAEQIIALKEKVQQLEDEITRLKRMPKRPKFGSAGGNPKQRSGKPGNSSEAKSCLINSKIPQKRQQEICISVDVPEGSRFKGYTTYTVQEIDIIPINSKFGKLQMAP